jgi:hypothetical protein
MLSITLKSGITHQYKEAELDEKTITNRLMQPFWKIVSDNNIEIYRTDEIAHVMISKK